MEQVTPSGPTIFSLEAIHDPLYLESQSREVQGHRYSNPTLSGCLSRVAFGLRQGDRVEWALVLIKNGQMQCSSREIKRGEGCEGRTTE